MAKRTFKIYRYDPDKDAKPYMQSIDIELDGTDRMMALVHQAGLRSVVYVVGSPRFASSAPAGAPYADKYPPSDPQVYAQRMVALAQRYPMVDVWQVWNEPNIPGFWQPRIDPEGYARLLQPTVAALRTRTLATWPSSAASAGNWVAHLAVLPAICCCSGSQPT